jgi:tripartite-type tricarboxylate transporter receptor subunit TctC
MLRRDLLLLGLPGVNVLVSGPSVAADAAYPSRPATLVAPFSAGGSADAAARLLAKHVPAHLPNKDATIAVENRIGASGALGTNQVAHAEPDGYTLLIARTASSAILPAIDPRTPYGWDDFTMLGLLHDSPFVVCVRADAPWQRFAELIVALREAPGRLTFATTGPATILDLGVRQLFVANGLPIDAGTALPFAGGADAVGAVAAGQAHFMGSGLADAITGITARTVRPLLVSGPARHPLLPDVPTAKEAQSESIDAIMGWSALFAPRSLPADIVGVWTDALASLAKDRAWVDATRRQGSVPRVASPDATREFVRGQVDMYRDLARRLGLV